MASKVDVQLTELYERSRSQFPVFDSSLKNMAFMENAGGSQASTHFHHISRQYSAHEVMFPMALQVPACVADAIRHHLLFNNAQLGAGHELSNRSTAVVEKAHDVIKLYTFGASVRIC